jgi:hypothetical protein
MYNCKTADTPQERAFRDERFGYSNVQFERGFTLVFPKPLRKKSPPSEGAMACEDGA